MFEQYAKSCNIKLKHFHLTIDSNLADASGQKYGLGSSAAVLVSVIKVLNEFYEMELSNLYIYKRGYFKYEITKFKFMRRYCC